MRTEFHRDFTKDWRRLMQTQQRQAAERLELFRIEPKHPQLHDHKLTGEWQGCRSINITGDIRAVYELIESDLARFIAIGTHSQLYKK